ncbi:MAG: hypothetical protein CMO74_10425 [Verrucomicrobiales bacterium]|nr:hypothetical protein [Verrucomicrobiales bacterium]|tara:strand:- start:3540 stop:4292 length:753 start_codon:yes stop_codon:yes gene_type:complete
MAAFLTLTRRELSGYFFSLRGYVIIAGVQLLIGASLLIVLDALNEKPFDIPLTEKLPNSGFFWLVLLLMAPIITMRTYAHEKSTGTFETLLATPVSDRAVVLAKFVGAWLFYLLAWAPAATLPFLLSRYVDGLGPVDTGPLVSLALGVGVIGAFFMAVGCFASALTRSQIIAAMTSFAIGTGVFLIGLLAVYRPPQLGWKTDLFAHISMVEHMGDFASGIVDSRHLVFYISLTLMFLYLTEQVLASRRWK